MATRFYLSSTAAATLSPSASGTWSLTTGFDIKKMSPTKDGSSMTSKTTSSGVATPPIQLILNRIYVSDALAEQTILNTTTLRLQLRGNLSSTAASTAGTPWFVLRFVSSDGSTVRGTWGAASSGDLYTTTLTNKAFRTTGSNGSSISISNGDYAVIEIGWQYTAGTNTSRTVTQSFGSNSASDLISAGTETTADNPWFEVSQTLLFFTPGAGKIYSVKQSVNRASTY